MSRLRILRQGGCRRRLLKLDSALGCPGWPALDSPVSSDEEIDLLRLLVRAGGNLTLRAEGHEPIDLRRVQDVASTLQDRGFVRMMASDAAIYVEITDQGLQELRLSGR